LQIKVRFFSKVSGSIKFGIFSGGSFLNLCFSKIGSWFLFKKFRAEFAQVSAQPPVGKIGFVVFRSSFGKQAFSFGKVHFSWLVFCSVKSGF